MALIKCPDCGKEISDRAVSCPNCGCPVSAIVNGGTVKIKLPNTRQFVSDEISLVISKKAVVTTSSGKVLWTGKHGETARFTVKKPVKIVIDLGRVVNKIVGTVEPSTSYTLVRDMGIHMLPTYRLAEVDVIDSEK